MKKKNKIIRTQSKYLVIEKLNCFSKWYNKQYGKK